MRDMWIIQDMREFKRFYPSICYILLYILFEFKNNNTLLIIYGNNPNTY